MHRKALNLLITFTPLDIGSIEAPTLFIQSSDDVIDVVGEEPPAIQDGGQHGCDGSAGHCLVVRVFVHLREGQEH